MSKIWRRAAGILILTLVGGSLGALLTGYLRPQRGASLAPALPPTRGSRSAEAPELAVLEQAASTLVQFFAPSARARFAKPSEALGVAVALTADGLVAAKGELQKTSKLTASTFDRRLLMVETVRDKKGAVVVEPVSSLRLFKLSAREGSTTLRPAATVPFEEIRRGDLVFALQGGTLVSWHRVVEKGTLLNPEEAISSETFSPVLRVDGDLAEGVWLYDYKGRLLGMAQKRGRVFPGELLEDLAQRYLKEGAYHPTRLGVNFLELQRLVPLDGKTPVSGVLLTGSKQRPAVVPQSPAAKAGLHAGDVLLAFDGRRLDGTVPLPILLQRYPPGTEVELLVLREGKEEKFKVVLDAE